MPRLTAVALAGLGLVAAACGNGGSATSAEVIASGVERVAVDDTAPTSAWVAGVNGAGWDFHRTLDGDAVSSPMSLGTAFSFARAGASSESGAALDGVFGFPAADRDAAANAVLAALEASSTGSTTLTVANRLFPDDEFTINQDFVDIGARHYGADLQQIDTDRPDQAADAVNGWVNERTNGLIPEIVTPSTVEDSVLVLVNTVYLKVDWAQPFDAANTYDRPFASPGGEVTVPFMSFNGEERRWAALEELGADAVELPYADGELAMWLIVPRDTDGLAALEAGLTAEDLTGLGERAAPVSLSLAVPTWEQELPPTDLLGRWLCPRGFCPEAPMPGVGDRVVVGEALHAAKVIVDEKGTEAAAATAIDMDLTSAGPEPARSIVADRPFLWLIEHQPTGGLLFLGRVLTPTPPQG